METKSLEEHLIWSYEQEIAKLRDAMETIQKLDWMKYRDDPIQYCLTVRWTLGEADQKTINDIAFRKTMRRIKRKKEN